MGGNGGLKVTADPGPFYGQVDQDQGTHTRLRLFLSFRIGGDKMRSPHCIRSSSTQCDLSSALSELSSSYMAEILSEPPLGQTSDLTEFPYSRSPRFCPYNDSRCFCSCLLSSPELDRSPGGNQG